MVHADQLTAYGTLALAVVGALQTFVTRQAVNSTRADVLESRRARVDASAPRVVFTVHQWNWPPHLSASYDVTVRSKLTAEQSFVMPRDAQTPIYVAAVVRMMNEGSVTALVTIPKDVVLLGAGGVGEPPEDAATWAGLTSTQTIPLGPGLPMSLWVRTARSVEQWVHLHGSGVVGQQPVSVAIAVEDTLADGVRDETRIDFRAVPLVPSGRDDHSWVLNPTVAGQPNAPVIVVEVRPTVRNYRGEPARHLRRGKGVRTPG